LIKVGDLIEIPEIKTVIQLKDIEESSLRQMILDSFVVTTEVMKNLEMILTSFSKTEGKGAFLKGHFGSGKSHFLSILSLLLRLPIPGMPCSPRNPPWVLFKKKFSLAVFSSSRSP
jgi:hypothetical protein